MSIINLFYVSIIIFGIALFILGIKVMSSSFKKDLTFKIKSRINNLSSNKLAGVLIGIIMTGLLQSSSAVTLIIVSLVHGRVIKLYNSVPIIMGANIGTTITAQLTAFGLGSSPLNLSFIILVLFLLFRKNKNHFIPNILLGFLLMLLGLSTISIFINKLEAVGLLRILTIKLSNNPVLGMLSGIIITSIIQSSSTGIAMLQILSSSNVITVSNCIPILLGQNIGTCVNTIIGSFATNKSGKRVAVIHTLFNIFGVIMFIFLIKPLYYFVLQLAPYSPARQIAYAHTIFNILTTIILLPLSSALMKISKKIIRD